MRLALPIALALAPCLAGCPKPPGPACGASSQCPLNAYCVFGQCTAETELTSTLSLLVTPSDPLLPPEQFQPYQLNGEQQPGGSFTGGPITVRLGQPEILLGDLPIPAGCASAGDAFPLRLTFSAPSFIPSLTQTFEFEYQGDAGGAPIGALPSPLSFSQRIQTFEPCTIPVLGNLQVTGGGSYGLSKIQFPGTASTFGVRGTIAVPEMDGGLQGAIVRILGPSAGGPISGDAPLVWSGGLLEFGFSGAGPSGLPIAQGETTVVPNGACGVDGLTVPACAQLTVEIGPSLENPDLPTIDLPVFAPLVDAGANEPQAIELVTPFNGISLPIDPVPSHPLTVIALDPSGDELDTAEVNVESVDGGIAGCATCRLSLRQFTPDQDGGYSFELLAGRYLVSVVPQPPFGMARLTIDVTADGGVFLSDAGTSAPGATLELTAVRPIQLSGTAVPPAGFGAVSGEVSVLTLPDLLPVAEQELDGGAFSLEFPPGTYLLLIQPDPTTQLPNYVRTLSLSADSNLSQVPLHAPTELTGKVQISYDGGLPTPVPQALLQFYSVKENGGVLYALPVATTVTDDQGNFSAPGWQADAGQ